PTPPAPPVGSLQYDLVSKKYTLRWESWQEFKVWCDDEQNKQGIQLKHVKVFEYTGSPHFDQQVHYVCSR
ncbi:hypothetical protein DFH08DRAFT_624596, partial [Mycena albidolilacea]